MTSRTLRTPQVLRDFCVLGGEAVFLPFHVLCVLCGEIVLLPAQIHVLDAIDLAAQEPRRELLELVHRIGHEELK